YYSRHLIMPELGMAGQRALKAARVLVIGAGGLGSPVCLYLAAAGVGRLGIVEFDRVEPSNLHRQVLYGAGDIGRKKLDVVAGRLRDLNPHINIEPYALEISARNAGNIVAEYDIVVDATDNFPTRYLMNDACVLAGVPDVYASIFRFEGQLSVFSAPGGPCYRCLYPEPPPAGMVPSCAEGGVLGVLPGIIGALQANEVLKLILGLGDSLVGKLLLFDALTLGMTKLEVLRDDNCPLCSERATIRELVDYHDFCGVPLPGAYDEAVFQGVSEITVSDLNDIIRRGEPITLIDVRTPMEFEIARLPDARLIPLSELEERTAEFEFDRRIICFCQTGVRSALAARTLKNAGYEEVVSVRGGIDAWSVEIDPSVPRY
ncbi:MAG TPA: molybdopterin-synthase adenylyltransferase MoeB, partial [Candidatus Baltobacteraceae bacterium]